MTAPLPLQGVRVLDLSTVVAGPYGAEVMGELGADVIRIEPPASRALPPKEAPISEAEGFHWALARNKRAMALNLKDPRGRDIFLKLAAKSDVVWDNFRPGVMQRLGLDHAAVAAVNPGIVSCSISGFGDEGPWSRVGAYDITVQALAGSMAITGTGEPGSIPCRWGVPVGDIAGSLYAVIGVLAALEERARTGNGQHVEIALLDAQLALNTYRVPQALGAGISFEASSPRKGGAGTVPYGPFCCADGRWITIAVASNFWKAFCAVIGEPALADDARYATLALRQQNQATLDGHLERVLEKRTAADWDAAFLAANVPAGSIHDIAGAFAQPQAVARGMRVELTDASGRRAPVAGSPLRFEGEPPRPQRAPSAHGADTADILASVLGMDETAIATLAADGITGTAA